MALCEYVRVHVCARRYVTTAVAAKYNLASRTRTVVRKKPYIHSCTLKFEFHANRECLFSLLFFFFFTFNFVVETKISIITRVRKYRLKILQSIFVLLRKYDLRGIRRIFTNIDVPMSDIPFQE